MHKLIIVLQGVYFDENKVTLVFKIVFFLLVWKALGAKHSLTCIVKHPPRDSWEMSQKQSCKAPSMDLKSQIWEDDGVEF
jgi:hypothetical protein